MPKPAFVNKFRSELVFLQEPPERQEFLSEVPAQVTIGDVNSNPLYTLRVLMTVGIIGCRPDLELTEVYEELVEIYRHAYRLFSTGSHGVVFSDKKKVPSSYTEIVQQLIVSEGQFPNKAKLLEQAKLEFEGSEKVRSQCTEIRLHYQALLKKLVVINNTIFLRFLGDILADRGVNDWFMLELLAFLQEGGVPFEILCSNHDVAFLLYYYSMFQGGRPQKRYTIHPTSTPSLIGLELFLRTGVFGETELQNLVNNSYLNHLQLLGCELTLRGCRIYTHAPINFGCLRFLADRLGVLYDDSTKEKLKETCDSINAAFVDPYIDFEERFCLPRESENYEKYPFFHLIWNRNEKEFQPKQPVPNPEYELTWVHGHDGPPGRRKKGVLCLNPDFQSYKPDNAGGVRSIFEISSSAVNLQAQSAPEIQKPNDVAGSKDCARSTVVAPDLHADLGYVGDDDEYELMQNVQAP